MFVNSELNRNLCRKQNMSYTACQHRKNGGS